ncbi:MAG TPA: MlaD family protein [Thermoleophilaceae bacterium]|nr:MlaD family protein [Thermoleophilaceae bacterium]
MVKETPSAARLAAMVLFAASCVGILLYLWLVFGGSVPLRPEGYRVNVQFPEATQLAQEADVRISGVNVGKVKTKKPDNRTGLTETVIELKERYAPIPRDTRAILRQKTLLGETYVELSPGTRGKENFLADGGRLPTAQVSPTVELDEIFRAFDPKTREALEVWMDQQGRAVNRGGRALNEALASLAPFARDVDAVLAILNRQERATQGLVRDTGEVFGALTERQGQLRRLIENSNRVFETTASRDRELADTFVAFPTFLRETRATSRRLTEFALNTDPLVDQLRPAARQLSPTLIELSATAPDLRGLFRDLGPLVTVSRAGLPALERSLDDTRPLLRRIEPFLRTLEPTFAYLSLYRREIAAFFANDTAVTQASDPSPASSGPLNYLRTLQPLNPEVLAAYPRRLQTNRSNPYSEPGAYSQVGRGLPVFGSYLCENPPPYPRLRPDDPNLNPKVRRIVERFVFTDRGPQAPPCREQAPLGRLVGQPGRYPRLQPIGE